MNAAVDFIVNRKAMREGAFVPGAHSEASALKAGEVLVRIDKFALTSNNITYGAVGDTIGYWKFFPAKDGWGRIPVWGFGTIVKSNNDALPVGERIYGYFPISTHLVVQADKVTTGGFIDAAAHRAALPVVYNQYTRVKSDPSYSPATEGKVALFRPLFITSFLIDDFLADNDFFGGRTVVLSSASSKTALGLAFLLDTQRKGQVQVVGLTSPGNAAFVKATGYYDHVVGYDDIATLAKTPSVFVDFAGNAKHLAAVHKHFGDALKYSCRVGFTHWEEAAQQSELPGPKPQFFFAPDLLKKRMADWGVAGFWSRAGDALSRFSAASDKWLHVREGRGEDAVARAYAAMIDGKVDPAEGHVLSL